jgi:hypothetical protein
LREYVLFILANYNRDIQLPEINPCSNGSIDLEWHTSSNGRLLINIRKDVNGDSYIAYYYGDKYDNKMQVKGSIPVNEFSEYLAVWMKQYLI